jgi:hypothetical protein
MGCGHPERTASGSREDFTDSSIIAAEYPLLYKPADVFRLSDDRFQPDLADAKAE